MKNMSEKEASVSHLNIKKHCVTAEYYADLCPPLSRFCMQRVNQIKRAEGIASTPVHICCKYCNSVYRPGNYKVKVVPKMKLTPKLQKLKQKVSTKGEQSLGKFQKKLLDSFRRSRTRVVMFCSYCKKKTAILCAQKPEKIVSLPAKEIPERKTKQSKKKMKQKRRRRAQLESEDLSVIAKHRTSSPMKPVKTVEPEASLTTHTWSTRRKEHPTSASFQMSVGTDTCSTIPGKSKKKAKSKDIHKTLQRMLQQERQDTSASKSSLHSFLSGL